MTDGDDPHLYALRLGQMQELVTGLPPVAPTNPTALPHQPLVVMRDPSLAVAATRAAAVAHVAGGPSPCPMWYAELSLNAEWRETFDPAVAEKNWSSDAQMRDVLSRNPGLLVIADLGQRSPSAKWAPFLYALLAARTQRGRQTILISGKTPADLARLYVPQGSTDIFRNAFLGG